MWMFSLKHNLSDKFETQCKCYVKRLKQNVNVVLEIGN